MVALPPLPTNYKFAGSLFLSNTLVFFKSFGRDGRSDLRGVRGLRIGGGS